ncbi:MAG: Amuc_1100 family pilus-like protein [Candidatus Omnitrophica bacterium]|nr:Amuc_1100 family pilus-like protein [Candidatus Omnitrophota bacterium]
MDAIVAKKFKLEIRIAIMTVVLFLTFLFLMSFISRRSADLNEKAALREAEIKKYRKTMGDDVDALIRLKDSLRSNLEQNYSRLESSLSKAHLKNAVSATPLSFKKMLFDALERIDDKAKRDNILLPQDMGFEEYRFKVPDVSLAPVLTSELFILEDIISLLIENKVFALRSVKLPHKVVLLNKKTQSGEEVSLKSLSMQLSIEADFNQLKGFLLDLAGSDKTYVLWKIDIKRIDDTSERLAAEINLRSIE